ncbi:8003_t:CDS:2, partial [Gigaspora margarita]
MSGHNIEGDYVKFLNDNYSDVGSVNSENSKISNSDFVNFFFLVAQQHFIVRTETLRVFISLALARYIVSWYRVSDIYSIILNNMVRLICVENDYNLSASSFSWTVFNDDFLVDLDFNTVIRAFGSDSLNEDFSLKVFIEREIILLDIFSGDNIDSNHPDVPSGYSSDDSVDSMVTESDEISCKYFDGQ